MADALTRHCLDCAVTFQAESGAPGVFRCWPCREIHRRVVAGPHAAVAAALKSGRLVRGSCEICRTGVGVDAHHDDYSKPLDVRWLCRRHHRLHHAEEQRELAIAANCLAVFRPLGVVAARRAVAYVAERLSADAADKNTEAE